MAADATIDLDRVPDLTGRLRTSEDADVRELAKAAYEMAGALNTIRMRLLMFDFGSDDDSE